VIQKPKEDCHGVQFVENINITFKKMRR